MIRKTLIASMALGLCGLVLAIAAEPDAGQAAPRKSRAYLHSFNLPGHGVAIEGFSPVSYFDGRVERGSPLFAVEQEGVTYHLTSAEQAATFRKNPAKFVPAFGGWCAFGMAVSDKFPVDPTNYLIVDGKLMLFLRNEAIDARALWKQGKERDLLGKANAHWKKVQG